MVKANINEKAKTSQEAEFANGFDDISKFFLKKKKYIFTFLSKMVYNFGVLHQSALYNPIDIGPISPLCSKDLHSARLYLLEIYIEA